MGSLLSETAGRLAPPPGAGWVLDLDGVIWLGGTAIAGAAEAVDGLRRAGVPVVFVTNLSALTTAEQEAKLAACGIDAAGAVVTSATAAGRLIQPGERVMVVGGPGIVEAVETAGATVCAAGPADAVIVGLDPGFDYDTLGRAMRAVRGGARLIGTNHDPSYPTERGLEPGGGSLLAAVAAAAEAVPTMAGKPNPPIVECVRGRIGPTGVVVGDRPDSDGLFARALGYEFALVLSGVTGADDLPVSPEPRYCAPDLAALVDEMGFDPV
ncbi:HAD-IIA family hydrolase [Candidatus Poriferisocius sp.]|uniref:HAD-IIA family hydrolase n=1 Tax=Candidatus Poriferisocius sp. TaxID=3101276 RepID=UPI003B5C7767